MKRKNMTKRVLLILAALVLVLALASVGIGNFLVDYAIGRAGDGGNRQVALEVDKTAVESVAVERMANAEDQAARTTAFLEKVPQETVEITADDGTRLVGAVMSNDSHRWAIVIHGYRANRWTMMDYAERYHSAGWQVLAPDLRGCGESGGDFVGMGWPDRLDILRWIDWIIARDGEAQIVLHGVSMGGATVMMTSGEKTPDAVKAFVDDCGYTSVWDIFSSELNLRFHLPAFPVLYTASAISGARAGWDFMEASALEQVKKCEKPMIFLHGEEDDFVPYSMMAKLYEAKPGDNKQMVSVPKAGHGMAKSVMGEAYWETVFSFVEQYLD